MEVGQCSGPKSDSFEGTIGMVSEMFGGVSEQLRSSVRIGPEWCPANIGWLSEQRRKGVRIGPDGRPARTGTAGVEEWSDAGKIARVPAEGGSTRPARN